MTAVILAGGKGTRFKGQDKARIRFDGKSLLERRISFLKPLSDELLIVGGKSRNIDPRSGARIVTDIEQGGGPLVGLLTGIKESRHQWSFVTACDMPFFSPLLFAAILPSGGPFDAVVPRIGEYHEPLFAFYSKSCVPVIEKKLRLGKHRIASIFDEIRVRFIEEETLRMHDPELASFYNINTQAELETARAMELGRNENGTFERTP